MKILKLCKPYLLSHKYKLGVYLVLIIFSTVITILSPYLIGSFLDALIAGDKLDEILRFCAIFGIINLLRIIINYMTTIMYTKMQAQMCYAFNRSTIRHIQGFSISRTNQMDSAYMSSRVGVDTGNLIAFSISALQNIIINTMIIVVTVAILLSMNVIVAIILISFLGVYAVVYFIFKKSLYSAGLTYRETQNKFFAKLTEQFKYIKLIKLDSIQSQINARADEVFVSYKDAMMNNQKVSYVYSSLDGIISTIAQIILFVIGGIQVLQGNFTIGMFTIFASYFNMILSSCRYFFGLGASYQNALAAYDRVLELLEQKVEHCGTKPIREIGSIECKDVCFNYQNKLKVIENFNAVFLRGNIYAIRGVNGTGKSTLIHLLIGMYIEEYSGCITYNGENILHLDMVSARRKIIGFAEQEPSLISDSIRFNITLCDENQDMPDDDMKHMAKCAKVLNMGSFLEKKGLDLIIDEKNSNTSGGEKQKIAIFKVLYKNPSVMIFDEPTSALDADTSKMFMDYLCEVKKDKIVIIITHDRKVMDRSDKIFTLD